jgi:hypothetical protein
MALLPLAVALISCTVLRTARAWRPPPELLAEFLRNTGLVKMASADQIPRYMPPPSPWNVAALPVACKDMEKVKQLQALQVTLSLQEPRNMNVHV